MDNMRKGQIAWLLLKQILKRKICGKKGPFPSLEDFAKETKVPAEEIADFIEQLILEAEEEAETPGLRLH